MKKLLALVLVLVLALGTLSGCEAVTEKLPEGVQNAIGNVKDKFTSIKDKIFGKDEEPDGGEEEPTALDRAMTFVFDRYKNDSVETAANYDVIKSVIIDGVTFPVTWTVNNSTIKLVDNAEDANLLTVVIPEEPDAEILYELTATVTDADGNTLSKTFKHSVPKFKTLSYSEYIAAEDGVNVVVEGIVTHYNSKTAGNSYNNLYIQFEDAAGAVYVYSLNDDPSSLNLKLGQKVRVTGEKDIYSGIHEIKNASVKVIDSTAAALTPVDITSIYTAAESNEDTTLTDLIGMYVTIKNVEITTQDTANKYYNFKLGNIETYLRVSSSALLPTISSETAAKIVSDHTSHAGYLADVAGVVNVYKGVFYLIPIDGNAFTYKSAIERSDKEKADYEAAALTLPAEIKTNMDITLPTATIYADDVTIKWESNNTCAVIDTATGKLTVTLQEEAQTVTITATVECGNEKTVKTFTLSVAKAPTVAPVVADSPVEGTAYKFYLFQVNNGTPLYLKGGVANKDFYLATTENYEEAIDVYAKVVDGGYQLYYVENSKNIYIDIYKTSTGYTNARLTEEPTAVYTFDTEKKIFKTTVDGKEYTIGTYDIHSTFSASDLSKEGFHAQLVTLVDSSKVSDADKVKTEKENLALPQTSFVNNETVITLPKVTTYNKVEITWKPSSGQVVINADGTVTVTLEREAAKATLTATLTCGNAEDTKVFELTLGAKNYKNATNITVAPVAGTTYVLGVNHLGINNGTQHYFTGTTTDKNFRIAISESLREAVTLYVEEVKENDVVVGYRLYFGEGANKKYLNVRANGIYNNVLIESEPQGNYFTWNDEHKILVCDIEDTPYIIAASGTWPNMEAKKLSDLTKDTTTGKYNNIYPAVLAELVCEHYYEHSCSETCAECGVAQPDATKQPHTPEFKCSDSCSVCGAPVEHEGHKLNSDGTACEYCGASGLEINELKLAAEKATLAEIALNYTSSKQFAVALKGIKYTDVTIEWTSSNESYVTVKDGVVTVKLGATAPADAVTLTAKLSCGAGEDAATDTVVYTLTLSAAPTLDIMDVVPVVGGPYQLYLYQGNKKANYFIDGQMNNTYYLNGSALASEAIDIYVEKTGDKYYMYTVVDGVNKYIDIYKSGTHANVRYIAKSDDVTLTGYTYSSEYGVFVTTFDDGGIYFLGTANDKNYTTLGAVEISSFGSSFIGKFAIITCTHAYDGDCDEACNACGEARTGTAAHDWTKNCQECSVCHKTSDTQHVKSNCQNTTCDNCEFSMPATEHVKANCQDTNCKNCSVTDLVPTEHTNDLCEDTKCSTCGAAITPKEHTFGDDDACTECGKTIQAIADFMFEEEKKNLNDIILNYHNSASFVVNTIGIAYNEIVYNWTSSNNDLVSINGKTITVKLGDSEATVTLTLKLSVVVSGTTVESEAITYELSLDARPNPDAVKVSSPAVGKAYKFYLYQASSSYTGERTLYFAGSITSKGYLKTTSDVKAATDVYLEAVEGGYRLYFYDGEVKTYIEVYETDASKAKASIQFVTDEAKLANHYTFNESLGILVYTSATNSYYIGAYGTFDTFGASSITYITDSKISSVGASQHIAYLATVDCVHKYDNATCDTDCNLCGDVREVEHDFGRCNDTDCACCDETREKSVCIDSNGDKRCDNCGLEMDDPTKPDSPVIDAEANDTTKNDDGEDTSDSSDDVA